MSHEGIITWEMFMGNLDSIKLLNIVLNQAIVVIMTEKFFKCAIKRGGKIVHPQVAVSFGDLRISDKCLRLRDQTEIKDFIPIYCKREREQSLICCCEALDSGRSEY